MVDVDEVEIVELLQHEMRRVVVDLGARMVVQPLEEHLEGDAVDQVLAGVELIADVHAMLVEGVEQRLPAPGELVEGLLDEARRARRPGIDEGPGERTGEGDVAGEPHVLRGLGGELHLLLAPGAAVLRLAVDGGGGEGIEALVIGRMHGDELALQMRGKFGDLDAIGAGHTQHLIGIGLGLGGLLQVEEAAVPAGDLDALVAKRGGPFGDRVP